jgi:hypothetical protein
MAGLELLQPRINGWRNQLVPKPTILADREPDGET